MNSEPAFPLSESNSLVHSGMSLRDWFAGKAMQGMYSNQAITNKAISDWCENGGPRPTCVAEWISGMSYEAADEMLKAREASC